MYVATVLRFSRYRVDYNARCTINNGYVESMRDWSGGMGGHTHGSRMRHAVAELPETLIWVTLTGSRDTALRTSLFGALGRHVSRTHVRRRACSPVRCKRV